MKQGEDFFCLRHRGGHSLFYTKKRRARIFFDLNEGARTFFRLKGATTFSVGKKGGEDFFSSDFPPKPGLGTL